MIKLYYSFRKNAFTFADIEREKWKKNRYDSLMPNA